MASDSSLSISYNQRKDPGKSFHLPSSVSLRLKAIGFCFASVDVIKNFTPFIFFIFMKSNVRGSLLTLISFLNLSIRFICVNEQELKKNSNRSFLKDLNTDPY